jgi:uncharacterized membrane protein
VRNLGERQAIAKYFSQFWRRYSQTRVSMPLKAAAVATFPDGKNPFSEEQPLISSEGVEVAAAAGSYRGPWRQGNLLVVHRDSKLPPFCVRTNVPAETTMQRTVSWFHPLVYIALLTCLLIFLLLAKLLQQRLTLTLPLSKAFVEQRKRQIFVSGLLTSCGLLLLVLGLVLAVTGDLDQPWPLVTLIVLGLSIFTAGSLWVNRVIAIVSAQKIDGDFAWIKGVHTGYLERLPVWPYE